MIELLVAVPIAILAYGALVWTLTRVMRQNDRLHAALLASEGRRAAARTLAPEAAAAERSEAEEEAYTEWRKGHQIGF